MNFTYIYWEKLKFYGFYSNPARAKLIKKAKLINSNIKILDLKKHIAVMRMIKQPQELEVINKAISITIKTITQ